MFGLGGRMSGGDQDDFFGLWFINRRYVFKVWVYHAVCLYS